MRFKVGLEMRGDYKRGENVVAFCAVEGKERERGIRRGTPKYEN